MPETNPKSIKIPIITGIITAVTTVLVSFIAIVPQLRQKDSNEIEALNKRLSLLENPEDINRSPQSSISISGTVFKDNRPNQILNNVEIFLVPASGSELMTLADDNGVFSFQKIQERNWWIIVRNLNTNEKSSVRMLLEPSKKNGEVKLPGALMHYNINNVK